VALLLFVPFAVSEAPAATTFNWTTLAGGSAQPVTASVFDAAHDVLYTGNSNNGGIWRCAHPTTAPVWVELTRDSTHPILPYSTSGKVSGLVLDTSSTVNVLYASGGFGVYLYPNPAGPVDPTAWTAINNGVTKGAWNISHIVNALAFDQTNNILFASTKINGGVFIRKLNDLTPVWAEITGPLSGTEVGPLAFDQANDILYAGGQYYNKYKDNLYLFSIANPNTSPAFTRLKDKAGHGNYAAASLSIQGASLYLGYRSGSSLTGVDRYRGGVFEGTNTPSAIGDNGETMDQQTYDAAHGVLYVGGNCGGAVSEHETGPFGIVNLNTSPVWVSIGLAGYTTNNLLYAGGHLFASVVNTQGAVKLLYTSDVATSATLAPPPSAPVITTFSPTSGKVGTTIVITGNNFGNVRGSSSVRFIGATATRYTTWTNTKIRVVVPKNAVTGKLRVSTVAGWSACSSTKFTVKR